MPDVTEIRHTHPNGFRSGEWAIVRDFVSVNGRECYLVEFPDGVTDSWVVEDIDDPYEFRSADVLSGEQ